MVETKPDNQNLEKLESMETDSQYLFKNIKNQVIDRLLDDIDISKVSKYPDLKEFVNKYSESPEKLEKDINDLPDSSKLLNSENKSILETIKEKVKKPLAIVCLLGVLMTGGGAIEDQNRDSKLTQLANNLGINNVVHAEEEIDWDSMMAEAEEGLEEDKEENEELKEENEELKEENDKQEERIKEKQQRLEMLREINEHLDEDIDDLDEDIDDLDEDIDDLDEDIDDLDEDIDDLDEDIDKQEAEMDDVNSQIILVSQKLLEKDDITDKDLRDLKNSLEDFIERMKKSSLDEEERILKTKEIIKQIESRL